MVKTPPFGAFVSLVPGKDGLVHISKLGNGKRIGKVEDVVKVGDKVEVMIADATRAERSTWTRSAPTATRVIAGAPRG